jgi:Cu2+-containing amine oxidase
MSVPRLLPALAGAAAAAVLLLLFRGGEPGAAQSPARPPAKPQPRTDEIIQEFPAGGPMQTAWKVRYHAHNPGPGLVITGAWFKTAPRADWVKVLENVRLSEIFVPYNNGTRIYDIGAQGNYSLLRHTKADAGPTGELLNGGLVVRELRDDGVLWKYYDKVRRAQDLVLWSTLGAGNYNYMMLYSFRGDGSVTARMGSTGKNLGAHETTGHMHHACWRIDVDLDDPEHNTVYLVRHLEPKGSKTARDESVLFNRGVEGGAAWNATEFTRLRVECRRKNGQGKKVAYDLLPLRPGTARHWGGGEAFTHYDFWVTPARWHEQYYVELPKYVRQRRKIADTNVVLWYLSPAYHLPRDEDGIFVNPENGRAQVRGVAMTTWCGFELRPRNLFDKTPLYP